MNIATLCFAGSENTLGLSVLCDAIREEWPEANIQRASFNAAKEADYLLVSLYWWRDVFAFVRFLSDAGIDPRKRKPVIILGGMSGVNPRPLTGYFHVAVLGDGEAAIVPILKALEEKEDPYGLPGVWDPTRPVMPAFAPLIPAKQYVDLRTNKTTRIEIARGCRSRCQFCQLAYMKPYREQCHDVVRKLILTSPTKTIALFAPDRSSHSEIVKIDETLRKAGKANTGSDTRLEFLRKLKVADKVRFGIEGFSEKTRKKLKKIPTNKMLIEDFEYIAKDLRTTKGKPITSCTAYLIADLMGEGEEEIFEFWGAMQEIDKRLQQKFTLFLSVSSFAPSPFTPLETASIHPYMEFGKLFEKTRPRFEHIVIAKRGGLIAAPQRLAQMLTIRGDEKARLVVYWLATKAFGLLKSTDPSDGSTILQACKQAGMRPEFLFEDISGETLPWAHVKNPLDPN